MESKYYEIWTANEAGEGSPYKFNGVHRKDLETENWHYYDTENGVRLHFRKQHMVAVYEKPKEKVDAGA